MERFQSIMLVAGLGCFVFAFLLSGLYPYMITDQKIEEATIAELAKDVSPQFKELKDAYPVAFAQSFPNADRCLTSREILSLDEGDGRQWVEKFGKKLSDDEIQEAWEEAYAFALDLGRDTYIADACWHCHSQFVRPVANEATRYGPVSVAAQDNNSLQRPMLWGTRRVGPDLTYEGGKRSNDWHVAHFWDPQTTSPGSVMARYNFYFRDGYQVVRQIDPQKASFADLDPETAYPYPGIHDTEEEAGQAMERIKAALDSNLAAEGDRMSVVEATGPDTEILALIAYLQWLGTWDFEAYGEAQE